MLEFNVQRIADTPALDERLAFRWYKRELTCCEYAFGPLWTFGRDCVRSKMPSGLFWRFAKIGLHHVSAF